MILFFLLLLLPPLPPVFASFCRILKCHCFPPINVPLINATEMCCLFVQTQ